MAVFGNPSRAGSFSSALTNALSLRDFRLIRRRGEPVRPLTIVWVVRRDWRAIGIHEFLSPRMNRRSAERALRADVAYWRRGPIRPAVSLARMSLAEYRLHCRAWHSCRAGICPAPVRD